jgi:hypothetical protein
MPIQFGNTIKSFPASKEFCAGYDKWLRTVKREKAKAAKVARKVKP